MGGGVGVRTNISFFVSQNDYSYNVLEHLCSILAGSEVGAVIHA
jgi:hypothetical protein